MANTNIKISKNEELFLRSVGYNRKKQNKCFYTTGMYCRYFPHGGVNWEMEFWATSVDTKRAVRGLNHVLANFEVQSERNEVATIINNLYVEEAPFASDIRFPFAKPYLRISKLNTILDAMLLSASLKFRDKEREHQIVLPDKDKSKDQKKPEELTIDDQMSQNKVAFKSALDRFKNAISDKAWVYDRLKFENELDILWCSGDPEEEVDRPLDEGMSCGPIKKPGVCPGTPRTVAELRALINKNNPQGLDADHWYVNFDDPISFSCDGVRGSVSLHALDDAKQVNAVGFIFAPQPNFGQTTEVYRYGYYLDLDKVNEFPSGRCADWNP